MISFACRLARPTFVFDAAFEAGQGVTALFGPSGCGKSTAIRLLAGLERPDAGRIAVGDEIVLDTAARRWIAPHRRRMGLVFQDAMLLPHLSVRQNLTYGRWFTPASERRIAFEPVVEVLGIGGLLDRWPGTLSGGERQRVAIGRALLASPRVLLMDEPLASLDGARKQEILPFIERLRDEFRIPIIHVSHAVDEVARLADKVVRLEAGKVVAEGSPASVLGRIPQPAAGSRFDTVSVLSGEAEAGPQGMTRVKHRSGDLWVAGGIETGRPVTVAIRATDVAVATGRPSQLSIRTMLKGRVIGIEPSEGPFATVSVMLLGGDVLHASVTRLAVEELGLGVGDDVHALIKSAAIAAPGQRGTHAAMLNRAE